MSKYMRGQKVKFRGTHWTISEVIDTLDKAGRSMYWIERVLSEYSREVVIAFESDIEGIWETFYDCTCGADKVGHPSHSHWCDKYRGVTFK